MTCDKLEPITTLDVMCQALSQALAVRPEDCEYHNTLGHAHRKRGALQDAVMHFQRAIELAPNSAEAHNNYAVCLFEQGNTEDAVAAFQRVLELNPRLPAAHYNLGNLRQLEGRLDDAIACYFQALQFAPDHVEAHTNLGAALYQRRRFTEAIWHYQRALDLRPNNPEAHNNLGALYHEQNELTLAIACYHRALEFDPEYGEARFNLGDALRDQGQLVAAATAYRDVLRKYPAWHDVRDRLGFVLKELGQFAGAEECYRRLVEDLPESSAVQNSLGVILHLQGKVAQAKSCYQRALKLSTTNLDSLINLAVALREQGELDRSFECYDRAATLHPKSSRIQLGLADVLCDQRRLEDARRHYERALELAPEDASIRLHRALGLLRIGDFDQGWKEFEWRLKTFQFGLRNVLGPHWQGQPLDGRTILVHAEQGLGDTLQFVRYLELVQHRGGKVVFACPDRLVSLLKQLPRVDRIVPLSATFPDCDCHAPLLSLPLIFGTTLGTIPARIPYLAADPKLVDRWRARLSHAGGIQVGVGWKGNPRHDRDRLRSIPFSYIVELCEAQGVTVLSLQKKMDTQPLHEGSAAARLVDLTDQMDQEAGPFQDTAAVMKTLDVVITCDTSLAHLAGALGVRVWVALDFAADWRWLLDREDSPWYPTMRLFRQTKPGDWGDVFQCIRDELEVLRDELAKR